MEDLLSLTLARGTTKTPQNIEAQTPSFYAFVGSYYWIVLRPPLTPFYRSCQREDVSGSQEHR